MPSSSQTKRKSLQAAGTFNRRADQVRHALFQQADFFDPADLVQLKYETLRSLQAEGSTISRAAEDFGLSRPTIYQAQSQFEQHGMEGLLPRQRGPKKPHKLTADVRGFLQQTLAAAPEVGSVELARRVRQRFETEIHPRTIEKALHSGAKKGRLKT